MLILWVQKKNKKEINLLKQTFLFLEAFKNNFNIISSTIELDNFIKKINENKINYNRQFISVEMNNNEFDYYNEKINNVKFYKDFIKLN